MSQSFNGSSSNGLPTNGSLNHPDRILGRRTDTGETIGIDVDQGRIRSVVLVASDPELPWISPGWIDMQVNGYGGIEFNDETLTIEQVATVSKAMARCGVAHYMPTIVTDSFEHHRKSLATFAKACEQLPEVAASVPGFHVEGPYISPQDGARGAHPKQHVRPPNWDEFQRLQEAAGGRIKLLTLAPEHDGAPDFIRHVVATGVLVAIGHTAASGDQIREAVDAGAHMSTHLGNGCQLQMRRHPNVIWEQLGEDRLTAGIIADGHHLPPVVVKSMVRGKTPSRCVLVSDITSMAGMPPSEYKTTFGRVEVLRDGRLVVAGQRDILAGASFTLDYCVANVQRFAGVDLKTAVQMVTTTPGGLLGIAPQRFELGQPADFTLFHNPVVWQNGSHTHVTDDRQPMRIVATYRQGKRAYAA